jgi:ubiquinone biosynthesis protein
MEVQPQLVLLQKTLLNIEGLGRQLYPELDLWATAKPFMERWMAKQIGPRAFVERITASLPGLSEHLPQLPPLVFKLLQDAERGRLAVEWRSTELQRIHRDLRVGNQRLIGALAAGSCILGGVLLLVLGPGELLAERTALLLGGGLLGVGAFAFLRLWWSGLVSREPWN